jgi:uroporphyrinogen decarboxylase
MTSKERLLTATWNREPDRVPVAPDTSNMIPCRLTGKPFWEIYLYRNPPLWKAYIDCCKYFGFDGWLPALDGFYPSEPDDHTKIVVRNRDRIITRSFREEHGKKVWSERVDVYYRADPPTYGVEARKIGLPDEHDEYWDIEGVKEWPHGAELLQLARQEMGDAGIVGLAVGLPSLGKEPESIYEYFDHPDRVRERAAQQEEAIVAQAQQILALRPDFLLIGVSGYLTLQSPAIARELGLSTLQRVTALAKEAGIPTHLHCCGKERALVEMCAYETDLNLINPLEPPPMGDCDLAEIKRTFGHRLALMGNLHTTAVMLHGTVEQVKAAARWCIEAAAEGGGFILSTGDQCGRDTPDENIRALIEVAEEYGRY